MESGRQNLVVEAIGAAVMAGAYWAEIGKNPALEAGFGKLARKHSRKAATFNEQMIERAQVAPFSPGP